MIEVTLLGAVLFGRASAKSGRKVMVAACLGAFRRVLYLQAPVSQAWGGNPSFDRCYRWSLDEACDPPAGVVARNPPGRTAIGTLRDGWPSLA